MKKKAVVASILWLLVSGLLGYALIVLSGAKNPANQIIIQLLAALIAIPVSTLITGAISTLKTAHEGDKEITTIETGLPLAATIFGPAFGLPDYFKVTYSGAKQSPVIILLPHGFTVDFGNGKVQMSGSSIYASNPHDGLNIKIHSFQQSIQIG